MALNIRRRKIDALKCMLNCNSPITKIVNYEKLWKVLICDKHGLEIISTLFTQKGLRDLGVTINLNINSEREALPDVPSIYFVLPTQDNITRICRDIDSGMYENYHINFISPINREKLEQLAHSTFQSDCVAQISKIFDQYTNFICLEDDLFVLHDDKTGMMSFSSLNAPGKSEKEIDIIISSIVDGLFSVCVTLGTIPVIRCPQGDAAERVAKLLDKKLRDNLRDSRNSLFSGMGMSNSSGTPGGHMSFERPLLVILDRSMDLATPLSHPWTYQALVNDLLNVRLNSVTIPSQTKKSNSYELWCENDSFWRDERHKPLPEIADVIQQGLEVVKSKEKEMTQLKSTMGLNDGLDQSGDMVDSTNKLSDTVSSLKGFLEQKKLLEVHTNIATYLVDQIKERKLDIYFELEEKLQAKQPLQEKSVLDMLSSPDGLFVDKLRLLLLAVLYGTGSTANSTRPITEQELDQLSALIQSLDSHEADGPLMPALQYVRSFNRRVQLHSASHSTNRHTGATGGLFTKFINHGQTYFMEGVKNFVAKKHKLPFTRMVHNLMEQNSDPETDNFKYFDPKLFRSTEDSEKLPRQKSPFQDAVVFVVGGGNYVEYQNLIEYCKTPKSNYQNERLKRISYGCTELLNSHQFLSQLSILGRK